jgi:arabinosaccharide transport system permease protein
MAMERSRISGFIYSWKVAPYVFLLPFILTFLVFWLYPLLNTVVMSFQDIVPGETAWIGLRNFSRVFRDTTFYIAIGNSFLYMSLNLVLIIPFPMLYAVIIDSKFVKTKNLFKSVLYLPALTSVVVSGVIFRLMFAEVPSAIMNQVAGLFGHETIRWLYNRPTSYFALLLVHSWRWTGVTVLYFLAGLQSIDTGLYESAEIDGASKIHKFLYITIPMLKPTTVYVLTINVYGGLSMFMESFMMWNGNESPQNIGLTIVGYLYRRGIERNQLGYASSIGLILLVIALLVNIVQLILNGTFKTTKD